MLIDIHCHTSYPKGIFRANGTRCPDPDELVRMLDAAGIDKAVVLSMVNPERHAWLITPQEVMQICGEYPDRLIPFCSVDPRMLTNSVKADFLPMLEYFKQAGFKGIGEYTPNIAFDDPLNMNLFKQIEYVGLPVIFHVSPAVGGYYGCYDELGLPRLEKVLKAFPELILLGHSQPFWTEISSDVTADIRTTNPSGKVTPGRVVQLMRKYPNLHGDLSAGSGYNAISRDPEFGYEFLEEFQDRLYFGTDIAKPSQELPQVEYFRKLRTNNLVSQEAYHKITWKNAAKLLNISV